MESIEPPGSLPPTSSQCALLAEKPANLSFQNIGGLKFDRIETNPKYSQEGIVTLGYCEGEPSLSNTTSTLTTISNSELSDCVEGQVYTIVN
mgnify:CR=1 FL=1